MNKIGRRKDKDTADSEPLRDDMGQDGQDPDQKPGMHKKQVPTPKRKDQEAARKRPLVAGTMSKEEKRAARFQERQERKAEQARVNKALEQADPRYDKYLPLRDRGMQRRYVRDIVDGQRRSLAQYSLIVMVVCLVFTLFIPNQQSQIYFFVFFYAFLLFLVITRFFLGHKIKKALSARFGEVEPGTRWYGIMRSIQLRRLRLPKPGVGPGEKPRL